MINSMEEIADLARKGKRKKMAVACANDEDVLLSLDRAVKEGIVLPVLFGKRSEIEALLKKRSLSRLSAEIVDIEGDEAAAEAAVRSVAAGKAQIVMKGNIATATFLDAVLDKEWGLRNEGVLSHVAVMEVEAYDHPFILTDARINIAPDLMRKKAIIENAVEVAHKLGMEKPRVAPLCAVEVVNPNMPPTIDAAILSKMAHRKQIKGCIVDGPLAFDNAISVEAARLKKIESAVAGRADILLAPDVGAGNVLYKALCVIAHAKTGGIVVGARAPIILTSRVDSQDVRSYSIALACVVSQEEPS